MVPVVSPHKSRHGVMTGGQTHSARSLLTGMYCMQALQEQKPVRNRSFHKMAGPKAQRIPEAAGPDILHGCAARRVKHRGVLNDMARRAGRESNSTYSK